MTELLKISSGAVYRQIAAPRRARSSRKRSNGEEGVPRFFKKEDNVAEQLDISTKNCTIGKGRGTH